MGQRKYGLEVVPLMDLRDEKQRAMVGEAQLLCLNVKPGRARDSREGEGCWCFLRLEQRMVDGDVERLSYSMSGKKMESLAGFSTMALYALLGMH